LLEQGFVDLPTQVEAEDVAIEFERAVSGDRAKFKTRIEHKTYSVDEVAAEMYRRLKSIDEESKDADDPKDRTKYAKRFPLKRCQEIVAESLKRANVTTGRVTDDNKQKFLQALGTLRRRRAKRVIYKLNPAALFTMSTAERQAESCSAAELRRGDKTVYFPPDCESTLPDEQIEFFMEVKDRDGEYRKGSEPIINAHDFRLPLNLVIADATPERKFVRMLCDRDNALAVDAWVKNTNQKYYWIEYAWKKGEHPKRGEFSPDFFIKIGDRIFVVEVKGDEEISDPSIENQKKYEYGVEHFERLNDWLTCEKIPTRYQLNFVSPKDYNKFFQLLREGKLVGFTSQMDIALRKEAGI
jgi:type III restriction enzyme